jgi:hypothetical protein
MDFSEIDNYSAKELEQFKSVCNYLLGHTYVVRTLYKPDEARISNPQYTFISTHYETIRDYLFLLDWELRRNDLYGYYYVLNTDEANRRTLNKKATAILLALRMVYEDDHERAGLEHDVICTVRDVLEKVVTEYAILPTRPNMDEAKHAFTLLENHSIIQRLDGRFSQPGCKFAILPTILTAVPSERLDATVAVLRKEDDVEETDEDTAG